MMRRNLRNQRRGASALPALAYPYSLSANGLLWLRADDAPNPVSSWVDRYGNFNFAQGTGTRQPAKIAGPNGQDAIDFDGAATTGDVLVGAETFGSNLSEYTLVAVWSRDANKSYNGPFGIDLNPANHGANGCFEVYCAAGNFAHTHNRETGVIFITPSFANAGIANTATYYAQITTWRSGYTPAIFANGVATATTETVNASWTNVVCSGRYPVVGLGYDVSTGYLDGKIAEIILLNTRLTDLTDLWTYLQARYALWLSEQPTSNCSRDC